MTSTKYMPSVERIARFHHIPETECQACGSDCYPERAHVVPRQFGGSNDAANLRLLCAECHVASPDSIDPDEMDDWIHERRRRSRSDRSEVVRTIEAFISDIDESYYDAVYRAFLDELHGGRYGVHGNRISSGSIAAMLRRAKERVGA